MQSPNPPSIDEIAAALLASDFVYAKTMPQFPHHYTLRKKWTQDIPFETVVQFIRDHGYKASYGGRSYKYLDINGQKYWSMGAPLPATILINRAEKPSEHAYDAIAAGYDGLHQSPEAHAEDRAVIASLAYAGGSVLDIGCGAGFFLDHVTPDAYLGVDPSPKMLLKLVEKHPEAHVRLAPFESFWTPKTFDLVVALYGAASYVPAAALRRIPKLLRPGGRYFLMFYHPDYSPVTYERSGVKVEHYDHNPDVMPGAASDMGNFFVIQGGHDDQANRTT